MIKITRTALLALALAAPLMPAAAAVDPDRPFTVVAVVDGGGFTPYHFDFVGSQHPWNLDADTSNDVDFSTDPASYLEGHPGATPLTLTLPTTKTQRIDALHSGVDAPEWAKLEKSTAEAPKPYWFPGTKIVAALNFSDSPFYGDALQHGSRSAASAAGNIHGTCPECLFVLVHGNAPEALAWAVSQPWIDVVTNSYGHGTYGDNDPARLDPTGRVPRSAVRDNIYLDSPVATTKAAAEAGSVITFSAGNGLLNAYDVPILTYWSSEKGPDWMITVGAVSASGRQTASGSGKPVDISSIGDNYPSTGGRTASSVGTHSGTSNASPVIGGYFAKLIQRARELLGDGTSGHNEGIVASGDPIACGTAQPACALGDGVLTRDEAEEIVFSSASPTAQKLADVPFYPTWPTTEYAYYYQGHGTLHGIIDGPARYDSEWRRLVDLATGAIAADPRPAGELNWMIVDSKCRQKIWGRWSGGYWNGTDPELDPVADPLAIAFDSWCARLP